MTVPPTSDQFPSRQPSAITARLLGAVRTGDTVAVEAILDAQPELIAVAITGAGYGGTGVPRAQLGVIESTASLLHVCVAEDQPAVAGILLDRGIDPNRRNSDGRTALHDSLEYGRSALIDLLPAHGAEIDICAAAIMGDVARMGVILAADPALASDASTGLSPLGWASYGGHAAALSALVEYGVAVDAADGLAPACECDHSEFVAAALAHGADPRESFGRLCRTALHHAAELRYTRDATASARILLDADAEPNARDSNGMTPLDLAEAAALAHPAPQHQRYDHLIALLRDHGGKRGTAIS